MIHEFESAQLEQQQLSDGSFAYNVILPMDDELYRIPCKDAASAIELLDCLRNQALVEIPPEMIRTPY